MGTSVLHIKTEVECRVFLFDEEKGIAKPGTYFNLEVRKGEQDLLFVSTEDDAVICFKSYNVEEADCDYRMTLEQSQFINVNAEVTDEEMNTGDLDGSRLFDLQGRLSGVVYSHDGLQLLKCQCDYYYEYHIKDGCKVIRRAAFRSCKNLTAITLPAGLTHVGVYAFFDCENLTAIILPASLTHVGDYSFFDCENLTAITLPASLTHIGDYVFANCKNLAAITLSDSLIHIGSCAFFGCKSLASITLPDGLTHIGNSAFSHCENLTAITLPDSLTHIGKSAFAHCGNLTAITLPDGLTHIEDYAFSHCENLTAITLPDSITHIGVSAFLGCTNLAAITLPAGLTHIGVWAFSETGIRNIVSHSPIFTFNDGCLIDQKNHSLLAFLSDKKQVSLPDCLTHISDGALRFCKNLTEITLPNSLTHIGDRAFNHCENLTSITMSDSLTHIGYLAFSDCENLIFVTLPDCLTYIGSGAFSNCNSLTTINMPDSLIHIGDNAFSCCDSLTHIFIPAGMKTYFEELLPEELHGKLTEMVNKGNVENPTNLPYYIFFDTETTGVPRDYNAPASNTRNWPRLVQLGWIVTDEEGNVLSQGNEIVKPEGFVIPADAARVHGITTEKAQRDGKPLREVIEAFLKDAKGVKCIVGHNISFDQKVVGAELYRLGLPDTISTAKSLCTMQAGTDYCKIPGYYGYKWPKLQELHYKLFGCDFEDAHDAMADITATKKCFFEMRKRGLI